MVLDKLDRLILLGTFLMVKGFKNIIIIINKILIKKYYLYRWLTDGDIISINSF